MKKNPALVIGISLPFIMIIVVVLALYIPRTMLHPKYDFLYVMDSNDYQECPQKPGALPGAVPTCTTKAYSVKEGKVTVVEEMRSYSYSNQKLYLYDVERDSSREVALEDVAGYEINGDSRSPDGFSLEYDYGNAGIFELFGGGYGNSHWVLKKGIASKPISVAGPDRYYGSGEVRFLGWVTNK